MTRYPQTDRARQDTRRERKTARNEPVIRRDDEEDAKEPDRADDETAANRNR